MKVYVEDTDVLEKKGTTKEGKKYHIRDQVAYAQFPNERYPRKIKVPLPDEVDFYEVGVYQVADESFMVGSFDSLKLGRLTLEPYTDID